MMSRNFSYGLSAALMGAAIVAVQPQIAVPQGVDEQAIAAIAKDVTVVINGQNPGSGVIISRQGNTYYVLTAKHVVPAPDEYEIVTSDGTKHSLDYRTVKNVPGLDLAIVQFTSNKNYLVAPVGDSDKATEGGSVYISGWPHPGRAITQRIFQLTSGKISGRPLGSLEDGYGLVYTNVTRSGMSGGPVLDANGTVIGIHGRAEGEQIDTNTGDTVDIKSGFNLGIPINSFLSFASQQGIHLSYLGDNFFENVNELRVLSGHSNAVSSLDIAPDNRTLASGSYDNTIKLWDLSTGKLLRTLSGHSNGVLEVAIAPNGRMLASASSDKTIKVWDLQTGKLLRTLNGHSDTVQSVAFSPDSQTLASGSDDKTIKIWNLNTGQLLHTLAHSEPHAQGLVDYVRFSPDGQTVASGELHGVIRLWNVQTGKLKTTITDERSCSERVWWPLVLSPLGEKIAGVCGKQDTVKVWDTTTGKLLYTIDKNGSAALAINRYGQLLAGADWQGNINIWNLHTGQLLRNIRLLDPEKSDYALFTAVAFSADGQTLVAGGRTLPAYLGPGYIYVFRLAR